MTLSCVTPPTILRAGHPILSRPAKDIVELDDPALARLIAAMQTALTAANGIGLAAPQIGASLRVILFHVPKTRLTDLPGDSACQTTLLINPKLEATEPDRDEAWEACLSLPGLQGWVPRWRHIRYSGLTLEGKRVEREVSGFHARVVQHECDHLEGCLYPQRMEDLSRLGFIDETIAGQRSQAEAV